jgi:hypothetical protein
MFLDNFLTSVQGKVVVFACVRCKFKITSYLFYLCMSSSASM